MGASISTRRAQAEDKLLERPLSATQQPLGGLIGAAPKRTLSANLAEELKGGQWFLDIIRAAIDETVRPTNAALTMHMDGGLLTNQLKGEGHLSARRLGLIGDEAFWQRVLDGVRDHFGWNDEAAQLERALEVQRAAAAQIERLTRKMVSR